jgi:SAM-dependent methyltransferase
LTERKIIDTTRELGRWYDSKYREMGDGWNTPAEECNEHLDYLGVTPQNSNAWLLDVGFGAGHFLAEAEKRCFCVGMEISEVGWELAKARLNHTLLLLGSIEDFTENHSYDYITFIGSLEHIVDIKKALENVRRVLTANGTAYFLVPNEDWKHFDQPNERTHTDEEWEAIFNENGFKVSKKKRWGGNQDNTAFVCMKK